MNDLEPSTYMAAAGRRTLMRSGPQSLAALAAGGLAGARVVQAEPIASPEELPVIDRLRITVVTDSFHHAFEPPVEREGLTVVRKGFHVAPGQPPTRTLQNEWGLSLHIESVHAQQRRRVLLDFGYTPHTLLNNLDLLSLDPSLIDVLALSHGHVDHFGGLAGFLAAFRDRLRVDLPLFVGGADCFCERDLVVPGSVGSFGAVDRSAIRDAGLIVTFADRPAVIADHGLTTGLIKLTSFERVLAPSWMRRDENGAASSGVPDDFGHEIAIAYHVRGRGLVVMTSCGHRGVVNSVAAAMKASGVNKLFAVMGGFHLAPHPADYQEATARALVDMAPAFIVPMHCTGEHFIRLLDRHAPTRFIRSSTGSTFEFTAD